MLRRRAARRMKGRSREHVECAVYPAMRENIAVPLGIESGFVRTVVRDSQIAGVSNISSDDLSRAEQLVVRDRVELCDNDAGDDRHERDDDQHLDQREATATSSSSRLLALQIAIERAATAPALGAAS